MSISKTYILFFIIFCSICEFESIFSLLAPLGYESSVFWDRIRYRNTLLYIVTMAKTEYNQSHTNICFSFKIPIQVLVLIITLYALKEVFYCVL